MSPQHIPQILQPVSVTLQAENSVAAEEEFGEDVREEDATVHGTVLRYTHAYVSCQSIVHIFAG